MKYPFIHMRDFSNSLCCGASQSNNYFNDASCCSSCHVLLQTCLLQYFYDDIIPYPFGGDTMRLLAKPTTNHDARETGGGVGGQKKNSGFMCNCPGSLNRTKRSPRRNYS